VDLNRIDCQYVDITVTATLRNGEPAPLTAVDVAVLTQRATPTADTSWTAAVYSDDIATVLLAGPDAQPDIGALTVPVGGGDLWIRVVDAPEVDAARIARINVI
jgi:dihydrofolate reductase